MRSIFLWACAMLVASATIAEAADYRRGRTVVVANGSDYARHEPVILDRGYRGALPGCEDPHVHSKVAGAFAETERIYWGSRLQLTTFIRPRELGFRSWGYSFVPRRFCSATTHTTDGRRREVVYSIAEGQNFAGVGYGVEWCVTGLDRPRAYSPACRAARP